MVTVACLLFSQGSVSIHWSNLFLKYCASSSVLDTNDIDVSDRGGGLEGYECCGGDNGTGGNCRGDVDSKNPKNKTTNILLPGNLSPGTLACPRLVAPQTSLVS